MEEKILFGCDLSSIENLNEELVIEMMEKIINDNNTICKCQLCIEDIYALSLNKIKPLYVQSTFKESTFKGYDLKKILDKELVGKAINDAITTISGNPNH
jgi:competence protein ComFB